MQQTHSADLRRKSLALAVVMALCGTAALNASAATSSASSYTTVAHTTLLRQGDAVLGALPMTQPIHVVVALKLRNKAVLDAFVADNAKNQSGGKSAQLMSSAQILANHAPTQQQAQAVASYLSGIGFSNVTIAPNRMLVSADGTAATARNAFMTSFAQVRTRDGRIAFANTDDVRVPASLGEEVLAVIGLQNVHLAHADAARSDRAHTDAVILHDPTDFASIYGGTGVAPASSVIVGILTNASGGTGGQLGQDITDLNTFATNHSLSAITTSVVDVNGAGGSTPGNDVLDVTSQDIVGIVGGQVKKLIFYNIPSTSDADLTAGLNEVVSQNLTKIIDVSYGVCETDAQSDGSAAADDTILEAGVAQGQTFAVSTGSPGGADQCGNDTNTPLWPASSQYVIAVTGTLLNASSTTWSSEQVYNGSGGSASTFEPMPSWQTSFGVSGTTRAAADVAFDSYPSSGANVIENGATVAVGGNTLAAALFTGTWASVLQARGTGFGFAGPVLYSLPAAAFHDITVGNNSGGKTGIGYTAGTGYDFASGRGSVVISNAVADSIGLGNQPPVANFTYSASGLTVNFTDTSTDSDGTIATHAWTFGDGTTSTAANPSHTYAAGGSETVTETVGDNDGATNRKTQTIDVGPTQLIGNPSFETGSLPPWKMQVRVSVSCNPADAYDGNCFVPIPAADNNILWQSVTIPASSTSATLAFHLWVEDAQDANQVIDRLLVQVISAGGQNTTLATFSNLDGSGTCNADCPADYSLYTYDMTPYIGQTVKVRFYAPNYAKGSADTVFVLDDVTLTVQ